MLTVFGLIMAVLYWAVLQRPALTYNTDGLKDTYTVSRGSTVYLENPLYPPDSNLRVVINPRMTGQDEVGGTYRLGSVDSSDGFRPSITEARLSYVRPGYPVYGLYVPSYVKPGTYTYRATATYRLNLFRTATLDLPAFTVVVE
jgi:hypothetical protein